VAVDVASVAEGVGVAGGDVVWTPHLDPLRVWVAEITLTYWANAPEKLLGPTRERLMVSDYQLH